VVRELSKRLSCCFLVVGSAVGCHGVALSEGFDFFVWV
jgi:hypothetical protein